MGKWSHLKGKYPKLPLETDYQQKLNVVLDSPAPAMVMTPSEWKNAKDLRIRDLNDFQLVKLYARARLEKEAAEATLKVLDLEIDAFTRLFVERFEAAGETSKTFEGGVTLSLTDEPYPTVTDQPKLVAWVKNNDLEALLTLNYQTMSSLIKNAILEGRPLPDGVDVYVKTRMTRRGGGKKGESE